MMPPAAALTRRQIKSRAGCKRCKERKIKCDERSPSCSQCSRRNYACPGYGRRVQWFQLREISAAGDLVTRSHRSPRTKHDRVKSKGQSPVEKHPQDELCDNTLLTTNLHKSSLSFCDTTTHLVEYYFSNVCPIISCFDSPSNPFRYEISNMMRTSKTVFCCIQAMSAAHLSMLQPSRIQERIGTQNHAIKLVSKDINALVNVDEKVLVSVILLGVSDPWHNPRSTGSAHFAGARALVTAWLSTQKYCTLSPQARLIVPMLIYWEMLASFVMPDGGGIIYHLEMHLGRLFPVIEPRRPDKQTEKLKLHPLTGAATQVYLLFAKVGHHVRRRVVTLRAAGRSLSSRSAMQDESLFSNQSNLPRSGSSSIEEIEEALLAYEIPSIEQVEETNDIHTPAHDILSVAEAYRLAALLQIYRTFPFLLRVRLPVARQNSRVDFTPPKSFQSSSNSHDEAGEKAMNLFLFGLATNILELISHISPESRTRTIQPLILMMAANELYRPATHETAHTDMGEDGFRVIDHWRKFVSSRLLGCIRYVSVTSLATTMDVVKEMWKDMDSGRRVFWLDIIINHNWETLLG